jgi:hypothetical protein
MAILYFRLSAFFFVYFAPHLHFPHCFPSSSSFPPFTLPSLQRELAARLFDDLLTDTVLAIDRVATRKLQRSSAA